MPLPAPAFSTFWSKRSFSRKHWPAGLFGGDDVEEHEVFLGEVGEAVRLAGAGQRHVAGADDPGVAVAVGENALAGDDQVGVLVVLVGVQANVGAGLQRHPADFLDRVVFERLFAAEGELAVQRAHAAASAFLVEDEELFGRVALAVLLRLQLHGGEGRAGGQQRGRERDSGKILLHQKLLLRK